MVKIKELAIAAVLLGGIVIPRVDAHADGMVGEGGSESQAMPDAASRNRPSSPTAHQALKKSALMERAEGADVSAAVGHYARARSLLIAAVREFDQGYAKARPDSLINSEAWRSMVIDRAEELEKVLDPQPRLTERGVRYSPDSRLLGVTKNTK